MMMTNKKAIEYLKDMLASAEANLHVPDMAEHAEALDMAIAALSCSEKPNESDLISRQDAIYHCRKRLYQTAEVNRPIEVYADIAENRIGEWLNELPSAQVDLSGFCDRLWKSAYDRGYERCKQDAIDAIEETDWYHQNGNKDMVSGANPSEHQAWYKADDVYKALESVPSAQRTGEWIQKPNIYGVAYCSECDYELHTNDTNFCPNCGAKMKNNGDD